MTMKKKSAGRVHYSKIPMPRAEPCSVSLTNEETQRAYILSQERAHRDCELRDLCALLGGEELSEIAVCKHLNAILPAFSINKNRAGLTCSQRGFSLCVQHGMDPEYLFFQKKKAFVDDIAVLVTGLPPVMKILGFITHLEYACFGEKLRRQRWSRSFYYGVPARHLLDMELLPLFVESTNISVYRARWRLDKKRPLAAADDLFNSTHESERREKAISSSYGAKYRP